MSLESWKAEFYPVEAKEVSAQDAVAHSLRKWEGLTPENLERHDLSVHSISICDMEGEELAIDSESCALCVNYFGGYGCVECPLSKVRGNFACDAAISNGEKDDETTHPYGEWLATRNPQPMIFWLKKAQEFEASAKNSE